MPRPLATEPIPAVRTHNPSNDDTMTTRHTAETRPDAPIDAPPEAILFDMDGVVLEGRGTDSAVHSRALDDVLERHGLTVDDGIRRKLDTYEYTDAFVAACEALGVDPAELYTEREERSAKRSVERLAAGSRGLCPDVRAIDRIAEHVPVGLVSNNYDPTVEFVIDHFRLDAFRFSRGRDLGPTGFRRRKPDPYYLEEALDALDASDGLYVGDRETDVLAARNAGLDGVLLRRDHNAEVEIGVDPVAEIRDLEELLSIVVGN